MNATLSKKIDKFIAESHQINDIGRPLFCGSPITSFGYMKIMDSELIYLSSSADWLNYFFEKNYHDYMTPAILPELFKFQYVIGATLKNNLIVLDAESKFNLSHVFSINQIQKNRTEIFIFAAKGESLGVENWYINNLQYLNQFCIYFKSSIELTEKKIIPVVIHNQEDTEIALNNLDYTANNALEAPKKILLTNDSDENYITAHELQCLKLIFQGKNALEIANILCRSVRTIETHIQNIKRKLHCSKRSELIQKIIEYKLHNFFIKI